MTTLSLLISCRIRLFHAHCWIFEKLRHVCTTSATSFILLSSDARAKVVGVTSQLHCKNYQNWTWSLWHKAQLRLTIILCRSISIQWSKWSIPINSSAFDMSIPPYMPFLMTFFYCSQNCAVKVGFTLTKQWSWWNTASCTTYPPSASGTGSVLLSMGRASFAVILVIPTWVSQQ